MIWLHSGAFLAVFGALVAFGVGYNAFVAWAEHKGYTEGYLSLVVSLGVAVTLAGAAVLDWQAAVLVLACFVASGTPMIVGSIWRYLRRRAEAHRAMMEEIEQ